ncbi:MFS transporter [Paludibacterium paludis]|uniref:MFS transporter n=1 Tax=Paludibacterium paludis TaxID=1225769 RepID=A0A918NX76_9NEIS|nr:MFS transporter [Paludibacterium paludis]GGY03089.1 MFS transporter [Paludibacterium paludis]
MTTARISPATPPLPATETQATAPILSPRRILLLASGTGFSVACLYYSQPMLGVLGPDIGASGRAVGLVPTLTQLGYALGILLLAPLGDRHDRRRIISLKAALLSAALILAALSPSLAVLLPASLLIGLTATLAQDIVPAAAALAPDSQRGKVVGTVMTGLLSGILLSRVVSGFVAEQFGWRTMFFAAAASIALIGVVLNRSLPALAPTTNLSYAALLGSLRTLWRQHGELRRAALAQGCLSVGFSAFWSTLALMLHGAPFHLGSTAAGAFGLAGAAGALAAPLAGHAADRKGPESVARFGALLALLAFVALALSTALPAHGQLAALALGAVVFDLGVQASLIAHQAVIYRIDPAARSRFNAVLFVCVFIGMAAGSVAASVLLAAWGWAAVMGLASLASLAALLLRGGKRRTGRR